MRNATIFGPKPPQVYPPETGGFAPVTAGEYLNVNVGTQRERLGPLALHHRPPEKRRPYRGGMPLTGARRGNGGAREPVGLHRTLSTITNEQREPHPP